MGTVIAVAAGVFLGGIALLFWRVVGLVALALVGLVIIGVAWALWPEATSVAALAALVCVIVAIYRGDREREAAKRAALEQKIGRENVERMERDRVLRRDAADSWGEALLVGVWIYPIAIGGPLGAGVVYLFGLASGSTGAITAIIGSLVASLIFAIWVARSTAHRARRAQTELASLASGGADNGGFDTDLASRHPRRSALRV